MHDRTEPGNNMSELTCFSQEIFNVTIKCTVFLIIGRGGMLLEQCPNGQKGHFKGEHSLQSDPFQCNWICIFQTAPVYNFDTSDASGQFPEILGGTANGQSFWDLQFANSRNPTFGNKNCLFLLAWAMR